MKHKKKQKNLHKVVNSVKTEQSSIMLTSFTLW